MDDFLKNIDGFMGIVGFKMRDDSFTVIKKNSFVPLQKLSERPLTQLSKTEG